MSRQKEQLRSIFECHALTVEKLAEAAEVAQSLVTDMLDGIPVVQGVATRVPLHAFLAHE